MRKMCFWLITILWVGAACSPTTVDEGLGETAVPEVRPTETATPSPEPVETMTVPATAVTQTPAQLERAESTAQAVTEDQPPEILLVFHRSGGFAGLDQEWTLYTDGQIIMPDGQQKMVDAAQLQALLDTIQVADFLSLNDSYYVPKDTCCDRFFYTITVQLDGATKTVETIDAAPEQPERLTAVLGAINELIQTIQ